MPSRSPDPGRPRHYSIFEQHQHHGARFRPRAFARSRRRVYRPGIWPDVSQVRQPRNHRSVRCAVAPRRRRRRRRGSLSILREEGIDVLLNSRAVRVAKSVNGIELMVQTVGKARETMSSSAESQTILGTHLLVAAGRVPNSDWLNTAAAGISRDKHGYIQVNDRLETNVPGVFALGDIKGGPAFTHISYDDFRIIRTNVIEKGSASIAG